MRGMVSDAEVEIPGFRLYRKDLIDTTLQLSFKFRRIEEEEALAILRSLDTKKAEGIDGISSKFHRAVAPGNLTSLFNASTPQFGSQHMLTQSSRKVMSRVIGLYLFCLLW